MIKTPWLGFGSLGLLLAHPALPGGAAYAAGGYHRGREYRGRHLARNICGNLAPAGTCAAFTGFGELELGDLLADRTQRLTDPDDAPAAPEHPVSRTGDLWLLGAGGDIQNLANIVRVPRGQAARKKPGLSTGSRCGLAGIGKPPHL